VIDREFLTRVTQVRNNAKGEYHDNTLYLVLRRLANRNRK